MSTPRFLVSAVLATAVFAAAAPAAHAAGYDCDASALRSSVLGATAVEPLVVNRDTGRCQTASKTLTELPASLPLLGASLAVASTSLTGDTLPAQKALAVGGLAQAKVKVLPELPITLPTPLVVETLGALQVQVNGLLATLLGANAIAIDLRPAVTALLPNGKLPNLDVLGVDVATAYAAAGCVNGRAQTGGVAHIAGVTVLGQPLLVDGVVEQAVNLLNTSSIDPSNLDLSKIVLPLGITLDNQLYGALLRPAIQTFLDGMDPIQIPATVAQLKVTPNEQVRTGNRLTQRALHVELSLLGQSLLDAVIGEASVSEESVNCDVVVPGTTPDATELTLACTKRRLVLTDVVPAGDRVRLEGVADKELAGKTVELIFRATEKTVATAKVKPDGTFKATAKMPPKSLRDTNDARYQAAIGGEESLDLKLMRRMTVTSMKAAGGNVTIKGHLAKPLSKPLSTIVVKRRVNCKTTEKVAEVKPRPDGTFTITVDAPEGQSAVVYRLSSRVRKSEKNSKTFPTFTLPRGVNLV